MDEGLSDSQGFVAPKPIKKKRGIQEILQQKRFLIQANGGIRWTENKIYS